MFTKRVVIYADRKDNLIVIATGDSKKWGLMDIDVVESLPAPFTDDDLDAVLSRSLANCYSKEPDEVSGTTVIERYLNVKGYSKAVRGRRCISLRWNATNGYQVTPTEKIARQGYVHLTEAEISLGHDLEPLALAMAVRKAMALSRA